MCGGGGGVLARAARAAPSPRAPPPIPPPRRRRTVAPLVAAAGLAGDGGAGAAPFPPSRGSASPDVGPSGRASPSPPRASATAERRTAEVETSAAAQQQEGSLHARGLGRPATSTTDRPPDPPAFMTATGRIIASEF